MVCHSGSEKVFHSHLHFGNVPSFCAFFELPINIQYESLYTSENDCQPKDERKNCQTK